MTAYVGRNARLYIDEVVVALTKNIKVQATAEALEERSMDEADPLFLDYGNKTYTFSMSKVIGDHSTLVLLTAGTKFNVRFCGTGSTGVSPEIVLTDCIVTNYSASAGETGGILSDVTGRAKTCSVTT